jgi:adenosylcobinamide-phosphate synthase
MAWEAFLNSSAALLVGAVFLDLAIGDPRWLPHPVVLMGKFIARGEQLFGAADPERIS